MKRFVVGMFEDFFFPSAMIVSTMFLVAEIVVLPLWFVTNIFQSEVVNYCLVMGVMSFPVGMTLVCFRPDYGNESFLARLYTKHYTKERRALLFTLHGVVGYMVMTSVGRVFDKEAQLFLFAGGLTSVMMLFLICFAYWLASPTWKHT